MIRWQNLAWAALASIMVLVVLIYVGELRRREVNLPILAPSGTFELTNQFGIRVRDSDLEGYVVVVDVIFSRCPGQCHRLSQQMRRLKQSVRPGMPVRFLSLTADPEYDTSGVLSRYAERYGADGASW